MSVHNINISSSAILVQILASFFPDVHHARFSFAVRRHAGSACCAGVPCWRAGRQIGKWRIGFTRRWRAVCVRPCHSL